MSSPMRSTTHSQRLRDFALLPTLPDDVRVLVQQALGEQTRGEQGGLVACAATLRRAATAANAVHSLHTHDVEAQAAAAEAAVSASTFVRMCHEGDATKVTHLITGGVDINQARDLDGWTGVMVSCYYGNAGLVELLCDAGAETLHQSQDGTTATFVAAQMGHLGILATILAHGGDPCMPKENGISPLYIATQHSFVEAMAMLISRGAKVAQARESGATPCFVAAQNGCVPALGLLLRRGAKTDRARRDGGTPLFIAAQNGHTDCVEMLIAEHAKRVKGTAGRLSLLTQTTADATKTFPLFAAAIAQRNDIIVCLTKHGAPIEQRTGSGKTPLFGAAQCGFLAGVQELARRGAMIDTRADNHTTPLIAAAQNGHTAVVAFLVDLGCNVSSRTATGWTPLMMAAFGGHRDCLRVLMRAGASITDAFEVTSKSRSDESRQKTKTQSAASLLRKKHKYEASRLLRNSLVSKRVQLKMEDNEWRDFTVIEYDGETGVHTLRAEDGTHSMRDVKLHELVFRDTTVLRRQWRRECRKRRLVLCAWIESRGAATIAAGSSAGAGALGAFFAAVAADHHISFLPLIATYDADPAYAQGIPRKSTYTDEYP